MSSLGLLGLSSIGKATSEGVDYTFDALGGFLLLLMLLLLVSLSASVFCFYSVYFLVYVLLLLMSSWSCSSLVVVSSLNKLD